MKRIVFADTGYWVALIHPRDSLHDVATAVSQELGEFSIVTSDMVLAEVLNMFSGKGQLRGLAAQTVNEITGDATIQVVPQTRQLFQDALRLYQDRGDKDWSLTDCASFVIMQRLKLTEALTDDQHYIQMGFTALLKA
ncbi:MAG: type II toxin-antitoxin system VapC family toxin [Bradyrhizobium sp.]|uniref:type II toxin-antitoxin system VapC family toxin n=1 Tax=Bradyrhizobium sp. TaxID=376 RepID=UPI001DC19EB7|nr:PIN domain-containing protein [Bradyrhizobium sp.]MBV9560414.1 type II toxin-antitoxin system VapC family toxin [Bradyrhizobium sp.]